MAKNEKDKDTETDVSYRLVRCSIHGDTLRSPLQHFTTEFHKLLCYTIQSRNRYAEPSLERFGGESFSL